MKRRDLQPCVVCKKGLAHNRGLTFYRVKIDHMVFDVAALGRLHALESLFGGGSGGAALAEAMGPDEDLAQEITSTGTVLVCQDCGIETLLHAVLEIADEPDHGEDCKP